MKKRTIILNLLISIILPITLFAHSLILDVYDNEDGTISIEGVFNTGESAAGAYVKLKALDSEEILFQKRLPDEGELTVKIPKVPYEIILDGGPGHTVSKEGIAPKEGFEKVNKQVKKEIQKEKKKKQQRGGRNSMQLSSSKAVNYSIALAFILLFATIFISIRNTNKILKVASGKK